MRQFYYLTLISLFLLLFAAQSEAQGAEAAQDINPISMQLDRAAPANYEPDSELEIQVTISANTSVGITAVGLRETPPDGWIFGEFRAISGDLPAVSKQDTATGIIEFAWISAPQLPLTFAYTLKVPSSGPESSGSKIITGQAEYRTDSGRLVTAPVFTTLQGQDIVKPEITLLGENPFVLEVGQSFQEPGYSAHDDVDGDVTGQVKVSGSVDTSTPGTYELTYTVSDKTGNEASKTRSVRVKDKPKTPVVPPPVAGGGTTPPPSNRRVTPGAVATAFDEFEDAPGNKGQGENIEKQEMAAESAANPVKSPNDTGQPSSPDNVGPKTQFSPNAIAQIEPDVAGVKGEKVAPAKAKTVTGKEAAAPGATKPVAAAKAKATEAPTLADTKVEVAKAEVVAKAADAALPVLQDTAPAAALPATSAPQNSGVFVRINDNLAKLTTQELMTLVGLGLALLVLSLVALVFWRGAHRPPMRR